MDAPPSRKHAKAPESVAAQRFPALAYLHAQEVTGPSQQSPPKSPETDKVSGLFILSKDIATSRQSGTYRRMPPSRFYSHAIWPSVPNFINPY